MYYIVNSNSKLTFLIDKILTNDNYIAIDTEFQTHRKKLHPTLSIIQICFPDGKSYVIDCVENNSNYSVKDIINAIDSSKALKVWFSAKQDLMIFRNITGKVLSNVFDIQIAVKSLGYRENIGLGELYEDIFNTKVNKSMQRSNWLRRPLLKEQVIYSFLDVYHIYKTYKVISKKLKEQNIFEEAYNKISKAYTPQKFEYNINKSVEKLRLNSQQDKEKACKLFALRECIANKHNVARKYVYDSNKIKAMLNQKPNNEQELFEIANSLMVKNYACKIIDIVQTAT